MAATKSQGKSFALFIAGFTVATAGLAYVGSGAGKLALVAGLIVLGAAFAVFFKIKPLEGKLPGAAAPTVMKLAGVATVLIGWLIVLLGLHLTASAGGRMATTLIGLIVSLAGVIGILPMAANKNAFWKA